LIGISADYGSCAEVENISPDMQHILGIAAGQRSVFGYERPHTAYWSTGRFGSLPAAEYTLTERLLSGAKRTSTNPVAAARLSNYMQIKIEPFPLVA